MYTQPYPHYQQGGGISCLGCLISGLFLLVAFAAVAVVAFVVVAIAYAIFAIVVWLTKPQERMYNAQSISRWSNAFEHGIYLLEVRLGMDFNSSPLRILAGVLILTLCPMIIIHWLFPSLAFLPLLGLFLTFSTTWVLSHPPQPFRLKFRPFDATLFQPADDGLFLPLDEW